MNSFAGWMSIESNPWKTDKPLVTCSLNPLPRAWKVLRITSVAVSKINIIFGFYFLNNTDWSIGLWKLPNTILVCLMNQSSEVERESLPPSPIFPFSVLFILLSHLLLHLLTQTQAGDALSLLVCRHWVMKAAVTMLRSCFHETTNPLSVSVYVSSCETHPLLSETKCLFIEVEFSLLCFQCLWCMG